MTKDMMIHLYKFAEPVPMPSKEIFSSFFFPLQLCSFVFFSLSIKLLCMPLILQITVVPRLKCPEV